MAGYNENPQTADASPKAVKFPSLSQDEELKKQSTGLVNEQSAVDLDEPINPKADENPRARFSLDRFPTTEAFLAHLENSNLTFADRGESEVEEKKTPFGQARSTRDSRFSKGDAAL